ncbi:MAG: sigma-54 dependent transcriptional regulator [Desulfobacterales bacterium]
MMADERTHHILIIDDELEICRNCIKILSAPERDIAYATNGYDALQKMAEQRFDVVITDLKMSRIGGMEVLKRINERYPDTEVIVMTGYASVGSAVEVMKMGAFDYLPKPFTPHELRAVTYQALAHRELQKRNRQLMQSKQQRKSISHQLIGTSPKIKKVIEMIQKVAPTDATVLLYGESGTGKELVARAVHANSRRKGNVFFAVDCGTLSGNLLESELFGYKKGAFTGAHKDKDGIFKMGDKGTIFLDEISNMNQEVQGKLLRFLETMEFIPIGGTTIQKVDVRLIFATNRNLEEMVEEGTFREDFYYRIVVYPINLPPLRERKGDILPIAHFFLEQYNRSTGKKIIGFDQQAAERLTAFSWPGNVRQLKNVIERAVILCENNRITLKDLPALHDEDHLDNIFANIPENNEELKKMKKEIRQKSVRKLEKKFLLNALEKTDWNVSKAAEQTGLQRTNFHTLMKKYGISRPE